MKICFTVPGKPKGKGRPRFYGGHAVTPQDTREYEEMTVMLAKMAAKGKSFTDDAYLRADITAYYPISKHTSAKKTEEMLSGKLFPAVKPDADNFSKIILDALNGVLYKDDAQIVILHAEKHYGKEPCVTVSISDIESDE